MTAVEWFIQNIPDLGKYIPFGVSMELHAKFQQALEMEKQQIKQTVLNLLHHELGHDDTARWLAERLEAGEIDVNDL